MHETASFVVKPETSPERQAFYDRLDRIDTAPLWEVLNRLVLPEPNPTIVPAFWKYDDVRRAADGGGTAADRPGGRAPRARPREPRPSRCIPGHAKPLRRPAVDPAGRTGPEPSSCRFRAPLHRRRRWRRIYGRRRRADVHADGRLRADALVDRSTITATSGRRR